MTSTTSKASIKEPSVKPAIEEEPEGQAEPAETVANGNGTEGIFK